jgi:hypothetical protein
MSCDFRQAAAAEGEEATKSADFARNIGLPSINGMGRTFDG